MNVGARSYIYIYIYIPDRTLKASLLAINTEPWNLIRDVLYSVLEFAFIFNLRNYKILLWTKSKVKWLSPCLLQNNNKKHFYLFNIILLNTNPQKDYFLTVTNRYPLNEKYLKRSSQNTLNKYSFRYYYANQFKISFSGNTPIYVR